MRYIALCAGALLLAGCASSPIAGLSGDAPKAKPKSVIVTDFVFSPEVIVLDRGYTARLDRKIGQYPTFERKQRTLERVNDEIVASIVVTMREAGLEAQPGSEEGLTQADDALLIGGKLQAGDEKAKPSTVGIGQGRGGVVADMEMTYWKGGSKRKLAGFVAEPAKKPAATPAARNTAIMAVVAATGSPPERLSPDVEGQARSLGRSIGERVVAYARDNGWVETPPEPEAKPKPAARAAKPKPAPKPDAN